MGTDENGSRVEWGDRNSCSVPTSFERVIDVCARDFSFPGNQMEAVSPEIYDLARIYRERRGETDDPVLWKAVINGKVVDANEKSSNAYRHEEAPEKLQELARQLMAAQPVVREYEPDMMGTLYGLQGKEFVDHTAPTIHAILDGMTGELRARWIESLRAEVYTQVKYKTWKLVKRSARPRGAKVIKSGWRCLTKYDAIGHPYKLKSRAYAAGYAQVPHEHFRPDAITAWTPRSASVRLQVATAAEHGLHLCSADVSGAFLHAPLRAGEEIFMEPFPRMREIVPELYEEAGFGPEDDVVLELRQCLYGLKQSGRAWHDMLMQWLIDDGFEVSPGDRCCLQRAEDADGKILKGYNISEERPGVKLIQVSVYVDDLFGTTNDKTAWGELIERCQKAGFDIRDESAGADGNSEFLTFLGNLIRREPDGSVTMSQPHKLAQIAELAGVVREDGTVRSRDTPLPKGTVFPKIDAEKFPLTAEDREAAKTLHYRGVIGTMLHVSCWTAPEVAFSLGQLARHANNPRKIHFDAVRHLAEYMYTRRDIGLRYVRGQPLNLVCFADADFAEGDPDTMRSVSGWVIQKSGCAIAWNSQLQSTVALSSMEAELTCLRHLVAEVMALRKDLSLWDPDVAAVPAIVWEDNQSCIHVAQGSTKYEARKHVALRTMFCVEAVERKIIQMEYIRSESQTSDVLTKCLTGTATVMHRNNMVNHGVHEPKKKRCAAAEAAAWKAKRAFEMGEPRDVVDVLVAD